MTPSPHRTLLEAVQYLHGWGFESVRVNAYFYATGHWRCELSAVGSPVKGGARLFGYTSASQWDYFGEGQTTPISADHLAQRLLQRQPGLAGLRTPATAYSVWYSALMDYCGPDGTFTLSDDAGYDALRAGYVRLLYPLGQNKTPRWRFPISPIF